MDKVNVDKVAEVMAEVEFYLYEWTTCYTGEYLPVSYEKWHKTFLDWFVNKEHTDYIKEYKEDVKNNNFDISMHCLALSPSYKNELYKKHKESITKFEQKYKLEE